MTHITLTVLVLFPFTQKFIFTCCLKAGSQIISNASHAFLKFYTDNSIASAQYKVVLFKNIESKEYTILYSQGFHKK